MTYADASGQPIVLQWSCASNRLYGVERGTNLVHGGWTCVESNITPVLPDRVYTAQPPAEARCMHYRISVRLDTP